MHWEKKIEKTTHYIQINHFQVVFGSHQSSGQADHAGVAGYAEFLDGRFHASIREIFGENILQEVIGSVQTAENDPLFEKKHRRDRTLLDALSAIPLDARLAGLLRRPDLENGGLNYGNGGGYKTILPSDTLTLTFEQDRGVLLPNAGGASIDVILPGHGSAAVALHDHFYIVVNHDFLVVKQDGAVYQERNSIFGDTLRIGYVYRWAEMIFFSYRWFDGNHPKGWLRYELGEGFIGRWVDLV